MENRTINSILFICFLLSMMPITGCQSKVNKLSGTNWEEGDFDICTGVNISSWLSQVSTRPKGCLAKDFFTEADLKRLAEWGFDHIRLPVDESQLFTPEGKFIPGTLQSIHEAIRWCKENKMRIVLDLHILRSHYFNDKENMTLWTDVREQDKLIGMWRKISGEFGHYPNGLLAYELLNEPVPPTPGIWNELSARLIKEIRKTEQKRTLIFGGGEHNSIKSLQALTVPENDSNLMLAFHFYTPHLLTHYKAPWMRLRDLEIPLHYPGQLVNKADADTLRNEVHKAIVNHFNGVYDKEVLRERMTIAFNKSRETGLRLYCSEFGSISFTDKAVKEKWFRDVRELFKENNVAGSVWGYKAGFGILTNDGTVANREIINILTSKN